MTDTRADAVAPFSILIPASNEAAWIGPCLDALIDQTAAAGPMHVIVSANACTDATVAIATSRNAGFAARGSQLTVIDSMIPGKPAALNRAEALASPGPRAFLDADVTCSPGLIAALRKTLDTPEPRFASGRLTLARASSAVTRRYGQLWMSLPFHRQGAAPGAGLFAVNTSGRSRWRAFPDVISDDSFVRLHFAAHERVELADPYLWPLPEGFRNLVRVRARQDRGLAELRRDHPHLRANDDTSRITAPQIFRLALRQPLDLATYLAIRLAARVTPQTEGFTRGR